MQKRNTGNKERKGDTSRTSSQGRKLASGGDLNKKGNPEIDEETRSEVTGSRSRPSKPRRR